MIPSLLLAAVIALTPAPTTTPSAPLVPATTAATCNDKVARTSRWFKIGAQFVNTLIVSNAVQHEAHPRILAGGSAVGLAAQYAAIDLVTDRLDQRASCKVRAAIDGFFGLGALYNTTKTEFPK